jgi:hypothetical protein
MSMMMSWFYRPAYVYDFAGGLTQLGSSNEDIALKPSIEL